MSRRYRPPFGGKRSREDAVEAALAKEDRTRFHLGITQMADLLGRDRGTISDWIDDKGCPTVHRGGPGEKTVLDPRDVVAWREEFVRDEEARKYARPEGEGGPAGPPMKPADMVKMVDLKIKTLALGQKAEVLVPRHVAEAAFQRCLSVIRETIMAIPENIVRDMAGFPEKQKLEWREAALKKCRLSLKEGSKAIAAAMPGFEPPAYRD